MRGALLHNLSGDALVSGRTTFFAPPPLAAIINTDIDHEGDNDGEKAETRVGRSEAQPSIPSRLRHQIAKRTAERSG